MARELRDSASRRTGHVASAIEANERMSNEAPKAEANVIATQKTGGACAVWPYIMRGPVPRSTSWQPPMWIVGIIVPVAQRTDVTTMAHTVAKKIASEAFRQDRPPATREGCSNTSRGSIHNPRCISAHPNDAVPASGHPVSGGLNR